MGGGADDGYDAAAALAAFQASRAGVRGLVESGVASVPPLFLMPIDSCQPPVEQTTFAIPTVDLALPHSATMPLATRSAFYSPTPVGSVTYSTIPIHPAAGTNINEIAILPWRDTLQARFGPPPAPELGKLPASCRDALEEYQKVMAGFGKEVAGLLSEALGVGAGRVESAMGVEGWMMACHYYPPCPEPSRVTGGIEHTDPSLFTVLAQDAVGGLQVRLRDGRWADVPPVPGALLVNIGDVLKVVSNDEYTSVEHRVAIKSSQDARVSIALFFNPAKRGDSDLLGPLPELVTTGSPQRYRAFTLTEFMKSRKDIGHGVSSIDRFRIAHE